MPAPQLDPVSIEHETIFNGPFSMDQLQWIGVGLLLLFLLLTIRDLIFARKRWLVPFLFLLRVAACAGVLIALAAPVEMSRKIFESGHNRLGIFLDTSGSMRLRDPVDGKGHLARWELTKREGRNEASPLAAIDEALTRVEAARALFATDDSNGALQKQLEEALKIINRFKPQLPYPGLVDEICERLRAKPEGKEVFEISKRIEVIARELARRDDLKRDLNNGGEEPSRLEWARGLLKQVEKNFLTDPGDELEVLRYHFAEEIEPISNDWLVATGAATNLNTVLEQMADQYRNGQIDAAILMTDAVQNDTTGTALQIPAELKDFPLFFVPMGGDYKFSDVTLWKASAPGTIGQGDFLSVDCLVGAQGYSGKTTRLRLLENGEELDSVEVTFTDNEVDQKFRLTTPVKATGIHRFEVEISPLPGEENSENNREFFEVNVFTGDLKVLLVDGWPRWETRYLSNLLKRDKTMDHREILFGPVPPDPFPDTLSSNEQLSAFQIVVLGEVGPDFLGAGEIYALENYVNQGGNLIVLAGRESMPGVYQKTQLADLLPVQLDRKRPAGSNPRHLVPTSAGRRIATLSLEDDRSRNESVWRLGSTLLPLSEMSPFNIPKPGSQVIVEARAPGNAEVASLPYIVWHRYGAGRVFYFPSPTTYHLRYRFGDRYHYRFWGQFLRWSTMADMTQGNVSISISTSEKRYRENDTPMVQIELCDAEGEPVRGAKMEVSLESIRSGVTRHSCAEVAGKVGVYEATLPALKYGQYRVVPTGPAVENLVSELGKENEMKIAIPEANFSVEAPVNTEDGDLACSWETVHQLVEATGGALIPPESLGTVIEVLSKKSAKLSREEVTKRPLWNRWPLFFLILIFLSAEWAGRKYAGLI